MNEITLRSANLEDLDLLLEFEQGVISAERPFEPTLKTDHINYYDIKAMIQSIDTELVVASIKDEIVASGYIKLEKSKPFQKFDYHAYIGFMFVKAENRGKGISQMIMNELLLWAKSKNIVEVLLDVYNDNLPAVRAYEKAGYKKHMIKMRLDISENRIRDI